MIKVGRLANPLGRFPAECREELKGFPHPEAYVRMRSFPVGVTAFGVSDLRWFFGSNAHPTLVLCGWLEDMKAAGMLHCISQFNEKGRLLAVQVTCFDLPDKVPDSAPRNTAVVSADAFQQFIATFGIEYRTATDCEWLKTGKEQAMAKRILEACGGADRACAFVRQFFHLPPEQQPDDLSFMGFYFTFPKLLSSIQEEEKWVAAKAAGEKAAAKRSQDFESGSPQDLAQLARLRAVAEQSRADYEEMMRNQPEPEEDPN